MHHDNQQADPLFETVQEAANFYYKNRRYFRTEFGRHFIVPFTNDPDCGLQPGETATEYASDTWGLILSEMNPENCNFRVYRVHHDAPMLHFAERGIAIGGDGGFHQITGVASLKVFTDFLFHQGKVTGASLTRIDNPTTKDILEAKGASAVIKDMARMSVTEREKFLRGIA